MWLTSAISCGDFAEQGLQSTAVSANKGPGTVAKGLIFTSTKDLFTVTPQMEIQHLQWKCVTKRQ